MIDTLGKYLPDFNNLKKGVEVCDFCGKELENKKCGVVLSPHKRFIICSECAKRFTAIWNAGEEKHEHI